LEKLHEEINMLEKGKKVRRYIALYPFTVSSFI